MFLHDQLNGSFTWAELLLALLISVAPLAVTILVKVALYRRRHRAGDKDGLLAAAADRASSTAAGREGLTRLREDALNEGEVRPITNKEGGKPAMGNRSVMTTVADHAELGHAIAFAGEASERARAPWKGLKDELARAEIVAPEEIPANVITMNSRAELLDLNTGERRVLTLVFPSDANLKDGKVSVLAPLGTAMLGHRAGDEFEWAAPGGLRRLKVVRVHYQPGAALRIGRPPPAMGPCNRLQPWEKAPRRARAGRSRGFDRGRRGCPAR